MVCQIMDLLELNSKLNRIVDQICLLEDLGSTVDKIVHHLSGEVSFCVWLRGPLGAGKTTFVQAILHRMGLARDVPVLSPTYTVMGDYVINGLWYAHLDLYRLVPNASLEDLGILDAHTYRGVFVEWPERCFQDPCIHPTHLIELDYGPHERARHLTFSRVGGG